MLHLKTFDKTINERIRMDLSNGISGEATQFPRLLVALPTMAVVPALGYWVLNTHLSNVWVAASTVVLAYGSYRNWYETLFVQTPRDQGRLLESTLSGKFSIAKAGLKPKYPWEKARPTFSLLVRSETKCSETINTSDKLPMEVKFAFTWKPDEKLLEKFLFMVEELPDGKGYSDQKVVEQIRAIVGGWLTGEIAKLKADEVKVKFADVSKAFAEQYTKGRTDIEKQLGIELLSITLEDVEYPESVRKANESLKQVRSALSIREEILAGSGGKELLKEKGGAAFVTRMALLVATGGKLTDLGGRGAIGIVDGDGDGNEDGKGKNKKGGK